LTENVENDPFVRLILEQKDIGGRFRNPRLLINAVGEGNFSLLFAAEDIETREDVVLKFFNPWKRAEAYRMESFHREPELLEIFKGKENIVQLVTGEQILELQVSSSGGVIPLPMPYFAIEMAPGSLRHYIYSDANSPELSLVLFREVTKGLQRIHRERVYHRDLKPSNCLIFRGRVVKICDFGTAKMFGAPSMLARYEMPVGEFGYAAWELFLGFSPDNEDSPRAGDLFALGAILFELFTKQRLTQFLYTPALIGAMQRVRATESSSDPKMSSEALLPWVLSNLTLPHFEAIDNVAPSPIRGRIERLYRDLADLDFRRRGLISFDRIFRDINISLRILRNQQAYARLQEMRRRMRGVSSKGNHDA
jgi:serine/threonine protein kinase